MQGIFTVANVGKWLLVVKDRNGWLSVERDLLFADVTVYFLDCLGDYILLYNSVVPLVLGLLQSPAKFP